MTMTLREKCAQMIVADYRFEAPDYDRAIALAKESVGGFCLFGGSFFDVAPVVNALQRHAKEPLLVASDFERGAGQQIQGATVLPPAMALGAARDPELAKKAGRVTAAEAVAMGVRWILAPVLDLNTNPRNPVINTRSFGKDPALATKLARAFIEGLREKGAIGCGKHFPGHGAVEVDSHLDLPAQPASLEALRAGELAPYTDLGKDLDSVMTAHLLVPALDPQHPASLSKAITEGLLRKEMKYEGLVVTDALMMGAIQKSMAETDALVLAAASGADLLLMPRDPPAAIGALEQAVRDGRLSEEAVTRASERVLAAKRKLGLDADRRADAGAVEKLVGTDAHKAVAQEIAEASIALAKGDGVAEPNAFLVKVVDTDSVPGDTSVFEKHLSTGIGRMVIAVFFRPRAYGSRTALPDHLVKRITASLKQEPEAVVVSFGSPYILSQIPEAKHFVCAWGEGEASQRAAAWAVQGKIPFRGKMPV